MHLLLGDSADIELPVDEGSLVDEVASVASTVLFVGDLLLLDVLEQVVSQRLRIFLKIRQSSN